MSVNGTISASTTTYTIHPFGDEWLWDAEDGKKPLTLPMQKAADAANGVRSTYLRGGVEDDDKMLSQWASGMWFTVQAFYPDDPERVPDHLAALIGPDGTIYEYDDPRCLFLLEGIGSDGEWPTPYPDDVILTCANCARPMVCQHPRHIRSIGYRDESGEMKERTPTRADMAERMPVQGSRACCGPVRG